MPQAALTVSVPVAAALTVDILKELSRVVAQTLSKPEAYVQTMLKDGVPMSFGGTCEPAASLEIKSIGGLTEASCRKLSEECGALLEKKLGIPPERFYIVFSDVKASFWGWNGSTFG